MVGMTKIAITGGIGSGKSYVCQRLAQRGIHVYDCDAGAKHLMRTSTELQAALRRLVGPAVYQDDVLQKRVLAEFLLSSEANKQAINDIVHPAVARDFERSGMDWLESAIYYESGFFARVHINIVVAVTAPPDVRISRIVARDHISQEKAREWIAAQMPQEEIKVRADYEIINDGHTDIDEQLAMLLHIIQNENKKQTNKQQ